MEDIKEALSLLKEDIPPNIRYKFNGGWIETDGFGAPVRIGVDEDLRDLIRELMMNVEMVPKTNAKIKTIYGIEVVETINPTKIGGKK